MCQVLNFKKLSPVCIITFVAYLTLSGTATTASAADTILVADPGATIMPPSSPQYFFLDSPGRNVVTSWAIKNTGKGSINVFLIETICEPYSPACAASGFTSGTILEGETKNTVLTTTLPCNSDNYRFYAGINVSYKDAYGYEIKNYTKSNITLIVTVPKPDIMTIDNFQELVSGQYKAAEYSAYWNVTNNGTGRISIAQWTFSCPGLKGCEVKPNAALPLNENALQNLTTYIFPDCNSEEHPNVSISITYDDDYGLGCISQRKYTGKMNLEEWFKKKPDGCTCMASPDCQSQCNGGVCGKIHPPTIEITPVIQTPGAGGDSPASSTVTASTVTVAFGTKSNFLLTLSNQNPITREIPMHLDSTSEAKNWVWFAGHRTDSKRRDMNVTIKPFESSTINLEILGARAGVYKLYLGPDAEYKNKYGEITITVVQRNSGIISTTPDMGWAAFFLTLAAGMAASFRRKAF